MFFFFLSNLSCHLSLANRLSIQSKDFLTNTLLITNVMPETLHRTEISTPLFFSICKFGRAFPSISWLCEWPRLIRCNYSSWQRRLLVARVVFCTTLLEQPDQLMQPHYFVLGISDEFYSISARSSTRVNLKSLSLSEMIEAKFEEW